MAAATPTAGPSSQSGSGGGGSEGGSAGENHPTIGLNLRVTGYCNQGGRKYMEDVFSVAYQQTYDEKDLEYAFFGIFDGHGGREAAVFAKEHLMDFIVRQKSFWADDDESVLRAIHDGFMQTHQAMWKELEKWPKTASGLPSTAGTTASIAFIRRSKIYVGHVGDSAIVLGQKDPQDSQNWVCQPLTRDHKPESDEETKRIESCGGKVVSKSGVPRVVWNRPRMGHKGPVRRSTHIDEIPFLAVARSLGDLWSYNSEEDVFVVSPEPDCAVYNLDIERHRCLILGTDGAWNMLTPQQAVRIVCEAEKSNEKLMLNPSLNRQWINPSKRLVDKAIEKWNANNLRADNTSLVTVMLDPPGQPRSQVLKRQRELYQQLSASGRIPDVPCSSFARGLGHPGAMNRGSMALVTNTTPEDPEPSPHPSSVANHQQYYSNHPYHQPYFPSSSLPGPSTSASSLASLASIATNPTGMAPPASSSSSLSSLSSSQSTSSLPKTSPNRSLRRAPLNPRSTSHLNRLSDSLVDSTTKPSNSEKSGHRAAPESPAPSSDQIQCNEISSSDDDSSPATSTTSAKGGRKSNLRKKGILKESARISRELSALQLDSPMFKDGNTRSDNRRRTRENRANLAVKSTPRGCKKVHTSSESSSREESNHSDAENEEQTRNRPRQLRSARTPTVDVELKVEELKSRIAHAEKKVSRRAENLLMQSRSSKSMSALLSSPRGKKSQPAKTPMKTPLKNQTAGNTAKSTRSLRPRTPAAAATTSSLLALSTPIITATSPLPPAPSSGRKRKQELSHQGGISKSPKTQNTPTVRNSKPVITRSRTAKVLKLRK